MDKELEAILESLPDKPHRSRLEPYRELIEELCRRGRTYRNIAAILTDRCHVQVAHSTLYSYLRNRSDDSKRRASRRPTATNTPELTEPVPAHADVVRQKIAALKARRPPEQDNRRAFEFDPDEPLRLRKSERQVPDK